MPLALVLFQINMVLRPKAAFLNLFQFILRVQGAKKRSKMKTEAGHMAVLLGLNAYCVSLKFHQRRKMRVEHTTNSGHNSSAPRLPFPTFQLPEGKDKQIWRRRRSC